ncbi:MAG: HDOD domain-containing protein [Sulfurimonas sp.]|uniref:EAL and HDOD domain-containing protein n=1 Tax=Sulfurimonas sp. TaxID=2022749 RepID=UPI0025E03896|nr:HDOD domain-containing protein [Sulfurimonas sp.]MCK9454593.1 HDOD domain-containing protein [Sulfurimonas sp.]
MQSLYFGRKPVLNQDAAIEFYELLYYSQNMNKEENGFIFQSLLCKALDKIGSQLVVGKRKVFIKVDESLFFSDKLFTISSEFFILSLSADIDVTKESAIQRVASLKEKGYILAIDDFTLNGADMQKYAKILDEVSFVKINFDKNILVNEENIDMLARVKERGVSAVGKNISDRFKYELSKRLGCGFFTGYYFSKAKMFEGDECKPPRLNILKLYSLLANDADFNLIIDEFKKNSSITILLLKYINSGAFHFKNRISSINHILTLVGREPLAKWLMLVVYSMANLPNPKTSPLMLMVKNRTELMERVLRAVEPDAGKSMLEQAYFVGVLSLIDVLFEDKMQKILDEMNVYDVVKSALLHDKGILGEIYVLVRDIEEFKPDSIIEFERRHSLQSGTISNITIECMKETSAFEIAVASI